MDDLEIAKRCARKSGLSWDEHDQDASFPLWLDRESRACMDGFNGDYDPLNNDGLAMALLKKFRLQVLRDSQSKMITVLPENATADFHGRSDDLNRAICECVAKMPD